MKKRGQFLVRITWLQMESTPYRQSVHLPPESECDRRAGPQVATGLPAKIYRTFITS